MSAQGYPRFRFPLLFLITVLIGPVSAPARITKSRPSASSAIKAPGATPSIWTPFYSLVIGSGFEYQRDQDQTEYGFPILIEYNFSEQLKLTIEPKFTRIVGRDAGSRSVSGFGDLETTVDYEFLRERRYRPALSLEGAIRWPTAEDSDLGEPGRDYTFGLVASKDLVLVDIDLNVLYTFIGDHEQEDTVDISLAAEWHVNGYVGVIAEVANVTRLGTLGSGSTGGRHETEATIGLSWQANKFFKFEQGVVFKEGGIWEAVFAWEWNFGGD